MKHDMRYLITDRSYRLHRITMSLFYANFVFALTLATLMWLPVTLNWPPDLGSLSYALLMTAIWGLLFLIVACFFAFIAGYPVMWMITRLKVDKGPILISTYYLGTLIACLLFLFMHGGMSQIVIVDGEVDRIIPWMSNLSFALWIVALTTPAALTFWRVYAYSWDRIDGVTK